MTQTAELNDPSQPAYDFIAGALSQNGEEILATNGQDTSDPAYLFQKPATGWQSTSSPNLEFGEGYQIGSAMQIGPNIVALGATVNQAGVVLLFVP